MGTVRDKNIGWLRARAYYSLIAQNGWQTTTGPVVTSLDTGGRAFTTRTGLQFTGLLYSAAGDAYGFDCPIPYDIDPSMPIGVRVWWTSNAAAVGTRTVTWQVLYGVFGAGAAVVQAATALDTVITAQAPAGINNAIQRGVRGVINANRVTPTSYWWSWRIVMSAFDAAFVENKYALGLEIDYVPRRTWGPGTYVDYGLPANPFAIPLQV